MESREDGAPPPGLARALLPDRVPGDRAGIEVERPPFGGVGQGGRLGQSGRPEKVSAVSSSFGKVLTIATFGESHGPAVGVILDGCPPGIPLDAETIQRDLDRRRPGQSAVTTQRKEPDKVEVLSGVFEGVTTGATIALVVRSVDARPQDYANLKDLFRPGHADYTYWKKYGVRDYRGSGRSSGRETVGRVAAGAVARRVLEREGARVQAYTVQVGDLVAKERDLEFAEQNAVRAPDRKAAPAMERAILEAREAGDSLGGVVEILASSVPAGLGDPVMDKLDASLAWGLMSIGAVKGFEVGEGFAAARMRGSEMNDRMERGGFASNHAGGILGGISTGEPIVTRIAVKPPSSIAIPQKTVDTAGEEREFAISGRHDPCLCPRVVPVAEAMTCLVLADALLRQRSIEHWRPKTNV
ncbi:MAG: chorismate synthase [Candidatus Eisenbacteria bacterium]|uniref:Chorismate synthase n=1 Tax=Eiseniibacteriota bacterium TaxID=2212470 RepID=A0A538TSU4_UNCEI|nr:MAG: chorismate synthase [Candidatus Eisenbacteria bacterium]